MLPMLFVPETPPNTVLCTGPQAEAIAANCLNWRDVAQVYMLAAPRLLKDKRVSVVDVPPVNSCTAVLTSPDERVDKYLHALKPGGIVCFSTLVLQTVPSMIKHARQLFPKNFKPWRAFIPEPMFGVLACPFGPPKRGRGFPLRGARWLSEKYLPSLFTFAQDETPLIFTQGGVASAQPAFVTPSE